MLIDWFTVGAQILNFLVLVWLLKRFLYKPILGAIDLREKRIAARLAKADEMSAKAREEEALFQRKNDELEGRREALLQRAEAEAGAEKLKLMDDARKAYEAMRSKQTDSLRTDAQSLSREMIRRTQAEVFAITRKALADLASESLEERIVRVFIERVRGLGPDEKKQLASGRPALIRSAFELPEAQRTAMDTALKAALGIEMQTRFETAPDLIGGIELTAAGNKISWSIAGYLSSLEETVNETLGAKAGPNPIESGGRHDA